MKKQYDSYETRWPNYEIVLYHDGNKVDVKKKSLLEMDEYIEQLEAEGYTRGYTEEDVEKARKRWEHIYENRIQRNIKPRCHKCIYELQCSRDKDNERSCPDYKRDASDGGYYG